MVQLKTFEEWFWNDKFWLPVNVSWTDLKQDDSIYIPSIYDLWLPFPIALGLFLLRLVWERFVALPIGRYYQIRETPPRAPVKQPLLEEAFKEHKKTLPDHRTVQELGKKIDWSERQVERWWRRKRVQGKPSEMQRFRETSWRFAFYVSIFWYGVWALWDKPWFADLKNCWVGYPRQHVPESIWVYYMVELGFYFSLLLSLCMDIKRKDFFEQLIHHFCTISLMLFSLTTNMMRIGSIVLIVHDAADPWLEGAKLAKYTKYHKICDTLFIMFTLVWFITRLLIYPFRVLHNTLVDAAGLYGIFGAYIVFNGMLLVLQALHIFWFYLILRMLHQYVIHGQVEKDERSETEPDTNSDDEEIDAKKLPAGGDQTNGIDHHVNANNNVKSKKVN